LVLFGRVEAKDENSDHRLFEGDLLLTFEEVAAIKGIEAAEDMQNSGGLFRSDQSNTAPIEGRGGRLLGLSKDKVGFYRWPCRSSASVTRIYYGFDNSGAGGAVEGSGEG
jgi:hypothetical protein